MSEVGLSTAVSESCRPVPGKKPTTEKVPRKSKEPKSSSENDAAENEESLSTKGRILFQNVYNNEVFIRNEEFSNIDMITKRKISEQEVEVSIYFHHKESARMFTLPTDEFTKMWNRMKTWDRKFSTSHDTPKTSGVKRERAEKMNPKQKSVKSTTASEEFVQDEEMPTEDDEVGNLVEVLI